MKNMKSSSKSLTSSFFDSKQKIIGVSIIATIVVLFVAVFMIVESSYGNWIVKNKTALKLEYVKTSFVNADSTVKDGIDTGSIATKTTFKKPLEQVNLKLTESNLEVRFQFENSKEMFTDVGFFNDNFKGNINITFEKTDDPNLVKMKIKAGNGIFQSKTVDCNEEFTINISEGKIYE
ncbi:MAG TPA: hypothetical protein VN258_12570 [Mobilitalea sp.]|nr:hypothetical protein [Mobilitalea sp.]